MISEEIVRKKLFEQFIKPTQEKKNFIGVEIEIPIINLDKSAVDFDVVHKVTNKFQKQFCDFKKDGIDASDAEIREMMKYMTSNKKKDEDSEQEEEEEENEEDIPEKITKVQFKKFYTADK